MKFTFQRLITHSWHDAVFGRFVFFCVHTTRKSFSCAKLGERNKTIRVISLPWAVVLGRTNGNLCLLRFLWFDCENNNVSNKKFFLTINFFFIRPVYKKQLFISTAKIDLHQRVLAQKPISPLLFICEKEKKNNNESI